MPPVAVVGLKASTAKDLVAALWLTMLIPFALEMTSLRVPGGAMWLRWLATVSMKPVALVALPRIALGESLSMPRVASIPPAALHRARPGPAGWR